MRLSATKTMPNNSNNKAKIPHRSQTGRRSGSQARFKTSFCSLYAEEENRYFNMEYEVLVIHRFSSGDAKVLLLFFSCSLFSSAAVAMTDHAAFMQQPAPNRTLPLQSPTNSTFPSSRPTPSNMLFLGYQHNYYQYPSPPQAAVSQLPANLRAEPLASLKFESSYKTSKSAGNPSSKKNHLSFAGFGNYGANHHQYDMDMSSSDHLEDRVPQIVPTPAPAKFDAVYGVNTGTSYTPACVRSQLQTICLDDPFYPTDSIKDAIVHHQHDFAKLYAEVAYQSADNLCDGLTRNEEEKYCNVFSQIHPISATNSWTANLGYNAEGGSSFDSLRTRATGPQAQGTYETVNGKGYICPSVIHYARILRAKNHRGQWRIVVNIPGYTQTSRIEECTKPLQKCQYITPKMNSACIQKWNFQRMLVWDKYNGFEMDIFRIPVSCSCFIRPRNPNSVMNFFPVINNMAPPVPPEPSNNQVIKAPPPTIPPEIQHAPESNQNQNNIDAIMVPSQNFQTFVAPESLPADATYIYPYWSLGNFLPYHEIRLSYPLPNMQHMNNGEYPGQMMSLRKAE